MGGPTDPQAGPSGPGGGLSPITQQCGGISELTRYFCVEIPHQRGARNRKLEVSETGSEIETGRWRTSEGIPRRAGRPKGLPLNRSLLGPCEAGVDTTKSQVVDTPGFSSPPCLGVASPLTEPSRRLFPIGAGRLRRARWNKLGLFALMGRSKSRQKVASTCLRGCKPSSTNSLSGASNVENVKRNPKRRGGIFGCV